MALKARRNQLAALERRLGKSARQIVVDAYNEHGGSLAAARSLDVNPSTFRYWMHHYGIQPRRIVNMPTESVA